MPKRTKIRAATVAAKRSARTEVARPATAPETVKYPSTDGKPMADNDPQARTMHYADGALRVHFRAKGVRAYVTTDTFVYYVKGIPELCVAPDVFVVLGVSGRWRNSYRVWEEGKPPDFVMEILSRKTHLKDANNKRDQYRRMGVREYFRFDPIGVTLGRKGGRRLAADRLHGDAWRPLHVAADGSIRSDVLGLDVRVMRREAEPRWRKLRFRDPETGEDLKSWSETDQAKRLAERGRSLAEQRAESEHQRAESEARARSLAEQRAESEARARSLAEQRAESMALELREFKRRAAEFQASEDGRRQGP